MKNVFTNVTWKTLKKNRTRTLVTIIGILLAAAMLTAVTTFISSLRQYMIRVSIEDQGNWYGAAFQVPAGKLSELSEDEEVTGLAAWQELGYAFFENLDEEELNAYRTPYLYVAGLGEGFTDMMPIVLTEGRMPENSREIVISHWAVNWGLLDVEIGDTLTLELGSRTLDGETLGPYNPLIYADERNDRIRVLEEFVPAGTREYTVVGMIETPAFMDSSTHPALYSLTVMDENPAADASYSCFIRTKHASDIYRFTDEKLSGCERTYNSELLRYLGSSRNRPYMRMLYGLAAILTALIMTGGISLVYNSFAISVSDRTKQFGLLSSVGATPKQLRGMVFREALLLGAIGIPLGIGAGILGIGVTLHFTGSYFVYLMYSDSVVMSLHVSWTAVGIAALTALVTVLVSAWVPARRAAGIPPIEAVRQAKDIRKPSKQTRFSRRNGSARSRFSYRLFGLPAMVAGRHFAREKRQYRVTIFSLFISIVLFISASSFSSYIRRSVFDISSVPDYDIQVHLEKEMQSLAGEISRTEGVGAALDTAWVYTDSLVSVEDMTEQGLAMYEAEAGAPAAEEWEPETESGGTADRSEDTGAEEKASLSTSVLILKDADYETWLSRQGMDTAGTGVKDFPSVMAYDRTQSYDAAADRYQSFRILENENAEITLLLTDSDAWEAAMEAAEAAGGSEEDVPMEDYQQSVRLRVEGFAEQGPMNLLAGNSGFYLIMPESVFRAAAGDKADVYLARRTLYLQAEDHQAVTERIQKLADEKEDADGAYMFVYDSRQALNTERNMLLTIDIFSYGFIALISLIAAANVFNTISTAFLLRRREFAVLSSVGMTPREMNRMLNFECLLYGAKALLYGIPVSLLVTWEIYRVVSDSIYTDFYVPALSILIAVFSVFAVVFAAMLYARGRMKHENIIDSIRQESL